MDEGNIVVTASLS